VASDSSLPDPRLACADTRKARDACYRACQSASQPQEDMASLFGGSRASAPAGQIDQARLGEAAMELEAVSALSPTLTLGFRLFTSRSSSRMR
jgi:hypothetical protein